LASGACPSAWRARLQRGKMRKQNPNDVVLVLHVEIDDAMEAWGGLREVLGTSGPRAKRVTVDAFTRIAVAFETFRSDWHIAAINRDSTAFRAMLGDRATASVRAGRFPALADHVRVELPSHPPLALIRDILDPQGGNLPLNTHEQWAKRAGTELCDPWKQKICAMRDDDRALLNAVVAIRNLVAHQSPRASAAMNQALVEFSPGDAAYLRRGDRTIHPSGIGNYLNAEPARGLARAQYYAQRLRNLVSALRV
jgi:hypothetical protein